MAEVHWAAAMGEGEPPLRDIPLVAQELYYDAMHAALGELRPTTAMLESATKVRAPEGVPTLHRVMIGRRFSAAMARLLQI